jgi:hypothetical protein
MAVTLSATAASTAADALCALLNAGHVRLYDGARPATADTAITTQVLLASPTFGNPAFAASVSGVATANAITSDTNAAASGVTTWFRAVKSDGSTVCDGSVGTANADCILSSTTIVQHGTVAITSVTYRQPLS